jgi:dihydropteroate synthase
MGREILCNGSPLVMGILNITPDSFYDGGRYYKIENAMTQALQMIEDGADIIDVGGESTKPFSELVSADDELRRVIPVIEKIRSYSDIAISIDTNKARVAQEAHLAGGDIVNDISGFMFDPDMAATVARLNMYAIIMHIKGTPKDMQLNPHYEDVISEIKAFFVERIAFAREHGVNEEHIILDPGIGFGKRVEDNLKIIRQLEYFKDLGRPILMGTSMKSFIGHVTDSPLLERVEGTLASVAISVWNGANIVRVHDVKKAKKVVKLVSAVMSS